MPGADTPTDTTARTHPGRCEREAYRLYADIVSLARETASKSHYLQEVLRVVTRFFASPYAALHVRYAAEVFQDDYHTGPTDPRFWKASLQDFLTDALGKRRPMVKMLRAKNGDTRVAFISAPIFDERGSTVGALALVLAPVDQENLVGRLSTLEAVTGLTSACTADLGGPQPADASADNRTGASDSRASAAAMARAGAAATPEELAFAITNELRNKVGCEQVALGLVQRRRLRILSISGLDQINRRSPGVLRLLAAMEECLDANEPIVCPRGGDWPEDDLPSGHRLHKQWHGATKGDTVASIPLRSGNSTVAILSLRSRADHSFTREQLEALRSRVEPYAPALMLARTASRNLLRHAVDSSHAALHALAAPGRYGRKLLAALTVAAMIWFVFGSMAYRPTVPCAVAPAHVRHIAAPFEGVLAAAHFVQGDRIREGEVLCEFDRRDVEQQIAKLNAELEVLQRERDRAMAEEKPVEVQLARAKEHLVRARLDIAVRRAQKAVIRAPFDGIIVAGDLRKTIGSMLAKGDPLFEVAPLDFWRLELEVPQTAVAGLESGLEGLFLGYARPEDARSFKIKRVLGTGESRAGRSVYLAEADISTTAPWLRPGMEGVAKIDFGPRPVWWVTLHGIIDYMRMTFWL